MTARRVGLTPTPCRRSSASGWMAAPTSQNAAADGSPGTRSRAVTVAAAIELDDVPAAFAGVAIAPQRLALAASAPCGPGSRAARG